MGAKTKKLAVVGGGQMGRALVGGMIASEVLAAAELFLVEPSADSRGWWAEHFPEVEQVDLASAVEGAEAVMLAVKPNIVPIVAEEIDAGWQGKLVVSIAAGISLDALGEMIGHSRLVRVMPNTPSLVGEGASAYCCGNEVGIEDRQWIQKALNCVGLAVEIDESQMDAVTGLSGSGPAYICLVVEALADGGVMAGLPRPLAMKLAAQTVLGTAKMISETGRHPGELKDAVASPGGTTIAALATLEHNGLRAALIEAVMASARRSGELGNK